MQTEGRSARAASAYSTTPSTAPVDIRDLLVTGIFALSRMDTAACPIMLLFTDGLLTVPTSAPHEDSVLSSLLQQQITLHVCQLGGSTAAARPLGAEALPFLVDPFCFGYVPDTNLLRFAAWFTGGVVRDIDSLVAASTSSASCEDPFAPASFRPEPAKRTQNGVKKTHRRGRPDGAVSVTAGTPFDSDDDEAAFIRSTQVVPISAHPRVHRSPPSHLLSTFPSSSLHPDDSGFEFESDQKHRRRNLTPGLDEADEDAIEDDDEVELEQIEDDEEDEEEEEEESYTDDSGSDEDGYSDSGRRPKRSKHLLWNDDDDLMSTTSSGSARGAHDDADLTTPLAQSISSLLTAATTSFFTTHPFVQDMLLHGSRITTPASRLDSHDHQLRVPEWAAPRYECSQQWQKVTVEGKPQLRKIALSEQVQSNRRPTQLRTGDATLPALVASQVKSYRLSHTALDELIATRLKEGFQVAHFVSTMDTNVEPPVQRCLLTSRMCWQEDTHIEYGLEWSTAADDDIRTHLKPAVLLVTITVVSTHEIIRALIGISHQPSVPPLPGGVQLVSLAPLRHPSIDRLDGFVTAMQASDRFTVQLQRVALSAREQALLDGAADVDTALCESLHPLQGGWNLRTLHSLPHLSLSAAMQLSVLPSSSYLSASHPLWRKLTSASFSVLRRWLCVSPPLDVISSLHRTYQINDTSLVDSPQNSRQSSDASEKGVSSLHTSENGVGTFIISWMELELELQAMQTQMREEMKPKADEEEKADEHAHAAALADTASEQVHESAQKVTLSMEEEAQVDDEYPDVAPKRPANKSPTREAAAPTTPTPRAGIILDTLPAFSGPTRLNQQSIMATLSALLSLCCSIRLADKQWLIFIPPSWMRSQGHHSMRGDVTDGVVPPFMLLRLKWTNPFLASLHVATSGCDESTRVALLERLKETIVNSYVVHQQHHDVKDPHSGQPLPSSPVPTKAQLHMFVPGTTVALPPAPMFGHAAGSKAPITKLFPFGMTHRSLSQVLLTPHAAMSQPGEPVATASSAGPTSSRSSSRAYMLSRSCHWRLSNGGTMATALALLRKARMEEGFVVVHSSTAAGSSTTYAREVRIDQTGWQAGDRTRAAAEPRPTHCMLQYCVHQVDNVELETEVWLESFNGFYGVPAAAFPETFLTVLDGHNATSTRPPRDGDDATKPAMRWFGSEELFDELCGWFHACDLHLLSIVATFDTVRDLEFSPGSHHASSYLAHPSLYRSRTVDPAVGVGAGDATSKLGLELHLDMDFHADLSFNYRFDARRRDRMRRARLQHIAEAREGKLSADGARLAHVDQSIQKSVLTPLLQSRQAAATNHLPAMSLLQRESSLTRSSSNPSVSASRAAHSTHVDPVDVTFGMSPASLYSALLSPNVTPTGSTVNLIGLNLANISPSVSGSPSPLTSPVGPRAHGRARSHVVPPMPLATTTPNNSFFAAGSNEPRIGQHRGGSGEFAASYGSSSSLHGGARTFHPSASQRWQTEGSKKGLRYSSSFSGPSVQQEAYAHAHGSLVPLSLTYLLDCSASTPLYFPVPNADHDDDAKNDTESPFIIAPTRAAASSATAATGDELNCDALGRSVSLPDQLNQSMKAAAAAAAPYSAHPLTHTATSPSPSSTAADSTPPSPASQSLHRLQSMLISAVRRLSDLELVSDRVFAQLVNEYTIIFLVLPGANTRRRMMATGRRIARKERESNLAAAAAAAAVASLPAASFAASVASPSSVVSVSDDPSSDSEEEDATDSEQEEHVRDDVDWYLDCLLAARGYSPIELSHLWRTDVASPAHSAVRLPELCAVLFECNRDEFGHPRTFPFPPPASLPTFGSLPAVMPPAHALLPLFPPPGPANVNLALLADGRTQLLPHTYLFLQSRITKLTIQQYRAHQRRQTSTATRKISGLMRQSSIEKLDRARRRQAIIPVQRHQRYMTQQLMYVDAMRYLFSTPPISCVAQHLPPLPHATGSSALDAAGIGIGTAPATTRTSRAHSETHNTISLGPFISSPSSLPSLSLDGLGDIGIALPSPSASSPMFAAATHLLAYHSTILAAHMRNYVRGVYLNLLEGMHVQQEDIRKAMAVCVPFAAEVDLSLIQTSEWKREAHDRPQLHTHVHAHHHHSASQSHLSHPAHAHHRHASLSLPPQSIAPPTPTDVVEPPHTITLAASHPLSRASIVARLQSKFESLMTSQFECVNDLSLYYYKPTVTTTIATNAAANMHALNPRPVPPSHGTILQAMGLPLGGSNKLPPPLLTGALPSSSSTLPSLAARPGLTKSSSAMPSLAGSGSPGSVTKTLSAVASGSGISIVSAANSAPTHPHASDATLRAQAIHAASDNMPFFMQIECVVYVTHAGGSDRGTTPLHLSGSLATGTTLPPAALPMPSSPILNPAAQRSRPSSPLIGKPPLPPRYESPTAAASPQLHRAASLTTNSAGAVHSTGLPRTTPRHLSRQHSATRPCVIPINVQTCIAEVLADIIAQRVSGLLRATALPTTPRTRPATIHSALAGANSPLAAAANYSPRATSFAAPLSVQLDQLHSSLQHASSVRTTLRLKCLTLRPHSHGDPARDPAPVVPAQRDQPATIGVEPEEDATRFSSPLSDEDAGEEERFYVDSTRRPSMSAAAAVTTTQTTFHSNDYEAEHGIMTDDAAAATTTSDLMRALSTASSVTAAPSTVGRDPTSLPLIERIFSVAHLPSALRRVMESLAASIECLVAEEVLHTLLTVRPVNGDTIVMVTRQVRQLVDAATAATARATAGGDAEEATKKKSHAAPHYHSFVRAESPPIVAGTVSLLAIPLRFVPAEQERARALFPEQLALACTTRPEERNIIGDAISRPGPNLTAFAPPSMPQIHAHCIGLTPTQQAQLYAHASSQPHAHAHSHSRRLYYMIDLLPSDQETYRTLQTGHMNAHEDLCGDDRSRASSVNDQHRRQAHSSFDAASDDSFHLPATPTADWDPTTGDHDTTMTTQTQTRPLPFWLLFELSPDAASMQVTFHHALLTSAQVHFVLEKFHRSVTDIVHRVNQLCLLNLLHATRVCSPMLLANPREPTHAHTASMLAAPVVAGLQSPIPPAAAAATALFPAGQFTCPKVLSMLLPLHDRLHPSIALRNIGPMALHPFTVSNRRNVYVYQEKTGAVYYLRLTTIETQAALGASHQVTNASTAQTSATTSRRHSGGDEGSLHLPVSASMHSHGGGATVSMTPLSPPSASGGTSAHAHLAGATNALLLDVYGLVAPGEEITVQLHSLLQSKLSTFTLSLLSQMLARNPLFKLTPADHRFIRGVEAPPAKAIAFPIATPLQMKPIGSAAEGGAANLRLWQPTGADDAASNSLIVRDPHLFMILLKQNMERFFTSLCLSYTVDKEKEKERSERETQKRRELAQTPAEGDESEGTTLVEATHGVRSSPTLHPTSSSPFVASSPLSSSSSSSSSSECVDVKRSDFFFLYNNYSNPSPSYLHSELGKGLSSIYLSLATPTGQMPVKQLHTHVHQPWRAQTREDIEQWAKITTIAQRDDRTEGASIPVVASSPLSALPVVPGIELSSRDGGFSSVFDHVSAGTATAEEERDEAIQLFDHMDASCARPWRSESNSLSGVRGDVAPFWLVSEVWSQGAVNHDALLARIQTIVHQTLHEYWMETLMYTYRVSNVTPMRAVPTTIRHPLMEAAQEAAGDTHKTPTDAPATTTALSTFDQNLIQPLQSLLPSLLAHSASVSGQASVSQRVCWSLPHAHAGLEQFLPHLAKVIAAAQPALADEMIAYQRVGRIEGAAHDRDDLPALEFVSLDAANGDLRSASAPSSGSLSTASSHRGASVYVLVGGFGVRSDESVRGRADSSRSRSFLLAPPRSAPPNAATTRGGGAMRPTRARRFARAHTQRPSTTHRDLLDGSDDVPFDRPRRSAVTDAHTPRTGSVAPPPPMLRHAISITRTGSTEESTFSDQQHVLHAHVKLSSELTHRVRAAAAANRTAADATSATNSSLTIAAFKIAAPVKSESVQPMVRERERDRSNTLTAAADVPLTLFRHATILVELRPHSLQVWTYNWKPSLVDALASSVSRLLSWCCFRQQLMRNLTHQKLGLFQHAPPVTTRLPIMQRNLMPAGQLTPQVRGTDNDTTGSSGGGGGGHPSVPAVLGRFTLQNIELLILHATPPLRGQPRGTSAIASSASSTTAVGSSPSLAPATSVAPPANGPLASRPGPMSPADMKMMRQRAQMYSRMRGGGPGAFAGGPHMRAGMGRGGSMSAAGLGGRSGGSAAANHGERRFEVSNSEPAALTSPQPPIHSHAHSTTQEERIAAAREDLPVTPLAGAGAGVNSSPSPSMRTRSGSNTALRSSLSPHEVQPPPRASPTNDARSSVAVAAASLPVQAQGPMQGPTQPTSRASVSAQRPIAVSLSTAAATADLHALILSRVRAFGRLLRGLSPPIAPASFLARPRSTRPAAAASDPLQFHAAQVKQLVLLSADFYTRPLETMNLCWQWIQSSHGAGVSASASVSVPRSPRLDASTQQFFKYLTQMSRMVRQVRVPLFFNRIVREWLEERQDTATDRVALTCSLPAMMQAAAADPAAPPPPLLMHLALLDGYLNEYVKFLEKEYGFVVVSVNTADDATTAQAADGDTAEAATDRLGSEAAANANAVRPKSRARSDSNSIASATSVPSVLLPTLSSLLSTNDARLSHPAATLPLLPSTAARVYLASDGPASVLPPIRVLLKRLFHGFAVLLTLEFDGCMAVTTLSLAPLPKLERNLHNAGRKAVTKSASMIINHAGSSGVLQALAVRSGADARTPAMQIEARKKNKPAAATMGNMKSSAANTPVGVALTRVGSTASIDQTVPTWPSQPISSTNGGAVHAHAPTPTGTTSVAAAATHRSSHSVSSTPVVIDSLSDLQVASSVYSRLLEMSRCLHSSSFLYDFHLRHFASFVMDPTAAYPRMDLLDQLAAFYAFYPMAPLHARNQVVRREFNVTLPVDIAAPNDFFAYLAKNANKYGLGSLAHRGLEQVVFLSSAPQTKTNGGAVGDGPTQTQTQAQAQQTTPDPRRTTSGSRAVLVGSPMIASSIAPLSASTASSPSNPFIYLFVAFLLPTAAPPSAPPSRYASPEPFGTGDDTNNETDGEEATAKQQNEIKMQYYIMRIDPHHRTPSLHAHPPSNGAPVAIASAARPVKSASVQWEELYDVLVSQVAVNAEKTIHRLCQKSLLHYQRDRVWHRLVHGGDTSEASGITVHIDMSELDFEILRALTFRRPLHAIDAQLVELHTLGVVHGLPNLCHLFVTHLIKVYYGRIRQFTWRGSRHVLIANKKETVRRRWSST